MKENHKKLLNSIMKEIDWESVLRVHKSFNYGVGYGNFKIPGLRRKEPSLGITIRDIKNELRSIIKYMIENDVPQMQYSYWNIFWTNDDWKFDILPDPMDDDDEFLDDDDEFYEDHGRVDIEMRARLEVLYCPQRIMLIDATSESENKSVESDENLEHALINAIRSENYEKAAMLRDILRSRKKI